MYGITKPNDSVMQQIPANTFQPCGRKKRSVEMILMPSSGALNGNFCVKTRNAVVRIRPMDMAWYHKCGMSFLSRKKITGPIAIANRAIATAT